MGFIAILLLVFFIISALLLIGIVLIQDEQGDGLGGIFGGGSSTPFGSRSGNVLTKFTGILAAIFIFCSFGLAWVYKTDNTGDNVLSAARQTEETEEWWNNDTPASDETEPEAPAESE